MKTNIRRIFKYFEPLWLGDDRKVSLRSVAAMALTIDFIINVHNSASIVVKVLNLIYYDKKIDSALIAAMSGNLAQIAMILGIEAGLIAAMLALKMYQGNVAALNLNQNGGGQVVMQQPTVITPPVDPGIKPPAPGEPTPPVEPLSP